MLSFASRAQWKTWLAKHHASSSGVWLELAKRDSGIRSVTYAEAIEVALCYGWIDGQKAAGDETHWRQRFSPRKARSRWSKINTEKAEALIASGAMQPAGQREVDAAKADGRWDAAYAGSRSMTVPDDLTAALARNRKARDFFETIDRTNRYAILYRINDAKRPETRRARIEQFVAMLAEHRTLHSRAGSRPKGSAASQPRKASS